MAIGGRQCRAEDPTTCGNVFCDVCYNMPKEPPPRMDEAYLNSPIFAKVPVLIGCIPQSEQEIKFYGKSILELIGVQTMTLFEVAIIEMKDGKPTGNFEHTRLMAANEDSAKTKALRATKLGEELTVKVKCF